MKNLKLIAFIFILLASVVLVPHIAHRFFSDATCSRLYPDQVSTMKGYIKTIESFRQAHGSLPPVPATALEFFSLPGYQVLPDGTYELHWMSFDGPGIQYNENNGRWQCNN